MDFHHRDGVKKDMPVSWLVNMGAAWIRIEAEMAKCDLVCANCHRIRHWGDKSLST
jgi:hypothetical protein